MFLKGTFSVSLAFTFHFLLFSWAFSFLSVIYGAMKHLGHIYNLNIHILDNSAFGNRTKKRFTFISTNMKNRSVKHEVYRNTMRPGELE